MTTTPNSPTWSEDKDEVYGFNYELTHEQRAAALDTGICADGVRCGFGTPERGPVYCDDCPNRPQPQYNPDDVAFKQPRYQDTQGEDWIDEFARTATMDEFRGAMRFIVGKYNRRIGKKDDDLSEVRKMRDYCERWEQYLLARR